VKKLSIPSQHDDFHRATIEAVFCQENRRNKSEENLSSQYDASQRGMME
jgi:hypothetical protein